MVNVSDSNTTVHTIPLGEIVISVVEIIAEMCQRREIEMKDR